MKRRVHATINIHGAARCYYQRLWKTKAADRAILAV